MTKLRSIESLVDRISERVEKLLHELFEERDALERELGRVNAYAADRDEECVRARQEMARSLEEAAEALPRAGRSGAEIEAKLQNLNNRLIELVLESRQG